MTQKIQEFHRPASAAEAAALLQRDAVVTAPALVGPRVADGAFAGVDALVDLGRLDLDQITESRGAVHIGAAVTLQTLADNPLLQSLADGLLSQAARLAGGSAMRHAATLGGLLLTARQALAGTTRDGPPEVLLALLLLGATLNFEPAAPGGLPLGDYLAAEATSLDRRLLLGVSFPRPVDGLRASLTRVARTPRDQAIVAAAVTVAGGEVRLAVAPGGGVVRRLEAVEASVSHATLSDGLLVGVERAVATAVQPASDFRATAEYRRAMTGVCARRAVAEAAQRVGRRPAESRP
jgi:CO/xanthine dehydrogenase FAD-binding subunit